MNSPIGRFPRLLSRCVLLLLVTGVAGTGCTKGRDGERSLFGGSADARPALPTAERARPIDVVWYAERDGKPVGGTSEARVLIKPNPSGEVRVAVFEEYSGGAGNQWRASAWMASFLASTLLQRNLTDYEFGVSTGGFVDGPSAGALTAAAMLAAMNDVPVRADVTMTGTVNPDGSIGPVGGIPLKIEGAAAKGKKVFGYPIGQRYDADGRGALVDVQAVGRDNGVEVHELRDVYDAYKLLTGKTLARPVPVETAQMEITPRYFQRMQAKTVAWLAKAESSIALLRQQGGAAHHQSLLDMAADSYDRAQNYQRQGMVSAAFAEAMKAAALAEVTHRAVKQTQFVIRGDLQGALLEVQSLRSVRADEEALRAMLATESPATASEALSLIDGYANAADARAYIELAVEEEARIAAIIDGLQKGQVPAAWQPVLRQAGKKQREALALMFGVTTLKPMLYYLIAKMTVDGARDLLEVKEAGGRPLQLSADAVLAMARTYTSAAKANIDYYDALVLQAHADRAGASLAAAKAQKAADDLEYLHTMKVMSAVLNNRDKTDLHGALANLAGSLCAYLSSAKLVAKEYSLGAVKNAKGELEVRNDKAFMSMLELAEEKAREQAALARNATGVVPLSAQSSYQLARALREKDTEARVRALGAFWMSTLQSQLAVLLSRAPPPRLALER